jgi:hypothetical protein
LAELEEKKPKHRKEKTIKQIVDEALERTRKENKGPSVFAAPKRGWQ